jgi:hypothetical protein
VLAGAKDAVVSSNVFAGSSPSNQLAVTIGTAACNIKVASNINAGSAKPPGFAPAVPATGVGVANTSAYSVTVNVNGGTVSQLQIAPALSGGFTGAAGASPSSVTLNPGDQIILNYSAAPTWQWTTINP